MDLTIKVSKVVILRCGGTDKISFKVEGPTPFPELEARAPGDYPPHFSVDTRRGYAEEWLSQIGVDLSEVTLIDSTKR